MQAAKDESAKAALQLDEAFKEQHRLQGQLDAERVLKVMLKSTHLSNYDQNSTPLLLVLNYMFLCMSRVDVCEGSMHDRSAACSQPANLICMH